MTKGVVLPVLASIILVLCISPVLAINFDITYEVEEDTIFPDEEATYWITIHNDEEYADSFSFYTVDPTWLLDTEPNALDVPGESSLEVILNIKPRTGIKSGPYLIPLRVVSDTTAQDLEENIYIYIKSFERDDRDYLPSVSLSVKVPSQVDPRTKIPLEITMRNRNLLDMDDLQVYVRSPLFEDSYIVELGPLEDKTQEVQYQVDPLVKAGDYRVTVSLIRNNRTVSEISKFIEVVDYSKIVEEVTPERELFKTTYLVNVENIGNEPKEKTIKLEAGWFKRIFTTTDPYYTRLKEDGKSYLSWDVYLTPRETKDILVVHNYRPLVTIIIFIILLIIGYFIFRSPLIAYKQAKIFGSHGSGIGHVKIRMFVKNRTSKPVYNIKVIERIPGLAEIQHQEATLGTLRPSKVIKHDRSGTIVRWDIEKFEPYEERIITYTIKSHLKLVGKITLPPAKIKFDTGLGKERSAYSNSVTLEEHQIRDEPSERPRLE